MLKIFILSLSLLFTGIVFASVSFSGLNEACEPTTQSCFYVEADTSIGKEVEAKLFMQTTSRGGREDYDEWEAKISTAQPEARAFPIEYFKLIKAKSFSIGLLNLDGQALSDCRFDFKGNPERYAGEYRLVISKTQTGYMCRKDT